MENLNQESDYSLIIDQISSMFGDVLNRDVIFTVVESCGGDLNHSVEAIMNITSEESNKNTNRQGDANAQANTYPDLALLGNENNIQNNHSQPSAPSYAKASQSTGALPKTNQRPRSNLIKTNFWTDQLRKIMSYHNQGSRVFIIMRGPPGIGKSYLSKQIVEMTIGSTFINYQTHIFSTDDFFMVRGQYQFNKYQISDAHLWNQHRVSTAAREGLSPIIIDNTNIELWEMVPYAKDAIKGGYYLEVVEPTTPWARKVYELNKRNVHSVPITTIKRMLENYQDGISGDYLKQKFGLSYPADMIPPVLRTKPPVTHDAVTMSNPDPANAERHHEVNAPALSALGENPENALKTIEEKTNSALNIHEANHGNPDDRQQSSDNDPLAKELTAEEFARYKLFMEAQRRIEEIAKLEQEWDNGENWDDASQESNTTSENAVAFDPKPPRNDHSVEQNASEKLMESVNKCNDWSQISIFMPKWNENSSTQENIELTPPVEKISTITCMELGDMDVDTNKSKFKIISATPRDINKFYIPSDKEKIPIKRMLDKSSMTNEQSVTEAYRCKNEEKHFVAFRKLFKNVARADLRDVFDNCCGDVNWAVDIVLDSMVNKSINTAESEDLSDTEETVTIEQCDCLAAYNVIPDGAKLTAVQIDGENIPEAACVEPQFTKKNKKETIPSESNLLLKRQIEQNIFISDSHYSKHCLKIRKIRRGEYVNDDENLDQPGTSGLQQNTQMQNDSVVESTNHSDDDDTSSSVSIEELEKVVNINLGMEFVSSLDNLFGRKDMEYPPYIIPKISLPLSILNEINALWMESLMFQLEATAKQMEDMVKQDEEFARRLATKEAELLMAGKEPAVPDFKEIMDMDLALSLYHKDVAEWRNNEPMDLAAKLTREKLFNLFPDVSPETLSELLMAHDNNFQSTVEVLLISTGRTDILEAENGVNKFVMEKELERKEKILEEERKALSEIEWPLLPKGEVVEMSTVNGYREAAEKHLLRRNVNYQKAQDYINRGMTQVANYYSDIAAFHKLKYEQSNSMAAASLIQVHAANNPDNSTIDLHYLRVSEAKESLDIFLDTHIQKLRENQNKGGPRFHTLFFITGRGLHSAGGPRVKPAVKRRLRERGLAFSERNPGLLTAKVCADDKLSYQLHVP